MKASHLCLIATSLVLLVAQAHGQDKPPGKKLDSLTTKKGRTYEKVEVREVTPSGIKILHDSGTATVPFEDLSEALQKELGGFDAKAAEEHRQKQDAALREHEDAIEQELAKQGGEGAAKGGPAAKPAASSGKTAGQSTPAAKAGEEKPKEFVEKGEVSARIVGYRTGSKRIEVTARANCKGKLEVHRVVPDEHAVTAHTHTYDVPANTVVVHEVWVFNDYSTDLTSEKGKRLDTESYDKKSNLGGLARPGLR